MKKSIKSIIATGVVASAAFVTGSNSEKVQDWWQGNKRFIVVPKAGMQMTMASHVKGDIIQKLENSNGFVMKMNQVAADELNASGFEVYEDRVYKLDCSCNAPPADPTPVDPGPSPDPGVNDQVPWGTEMVDALKAVAKVKGGKAIVCVVDTGLDFNHEDIKGAVAGGKSFVQGNASYFDDQGHGTHVAGTIAALPNNKGIIGVAGGIAQIYAVKVLDRSGTGYGSWIGDGIRECVKVKADVINMSLGSPRNAGPDPYIRSATDYAIQSGVIVVAANGNDGTDGVGYPAANPGVYGISAVDRNGRLASFSTYGIDTDYAGPGVDVLSLRAGGGYVQYSGTSMATPHVAAIFALCKVAGCRQLGVKSLGLGPKKEGQGLADAWLSVQ